MKHLEFYSDILVSILDILDILDIQKLWKYEKVLDGKCKYKKVKSVESARRDGWPSESLFAPDCKHNVIVRTQNWAALKGRVSDFIWGANFPPLCRCGLYLCEMYIVTLYSFWTYK